MDAGHRALAALGPGAAASSWRPILGPGTAVISAAGPWGEAVYCGGRYRAHPVGGPGWRQAARGSGRPAACWRPVVLVTWAVTHRGLRFWGRGWAEAGAPWRPNPLTSRRARGGIGDQAAAAARLKAPGACRDQVRRVERGPRRASRWPPRLTGARGWRWAARWLRDRGVRRQPGPTEMPPRPCTASVSRAYFASDASRELPRPG